MGSQRSRQRGHNLYVAEDTNGGADIDINALFDPNTSDVGKDIHLSVKRSDGLIVDDDDFGSGSTKSDERLPVTPTARDFAIKAWLDENGNGQWDTGEDKREVDVHVIGLRSDNDGDGVVERLDDALNLLQPTALNLEGNGQRTEFDLSIGGPSGSGGGYKIVVPNVAGLELWTAATGGTQLTPDANGNIIDTSLSGYSGQYTCTLWVSAASATTEDTGMSAMAMMAPAAEPAGPTGDATIPLEIKDQAGRTVAQSDVAVNKPSEILYAVDGTGDHRGSNTVVEQFYQRFNGAARYYFAGPTNFVTGADGPAILQDVENQIATNLAYAAQHHRILVIDMVGYSRGAVIAATVAKDLFTGIQVNGVTEKNIDVHWLGLFDAVSIWLAGVVPHPGTAWATTLSANVQYCDCAIKTKPLRLLPTQPITEDNAETVKYGGAKVVTQEFHLNHIDLGHNKLSRPENITPLAWMIQQAKKKDGADVPVK